MAISMENADSAPPSPMRLFPWNNPLARDPMIPGTGPGPEALKEPDPVLLEMVSIRPELNVMVLVSEKSNQTTSPDTEAGDHTEPPPPEPTGMSLPKS